jgi:hypothetical protein
MQNHDVSKKLNCWDYFKCGREISNPKRSDSVCNVSLISSQHGINGGINAGRHCWEIEGSYCAISFAQSIDEKQKNSTHGTISHKEQHCKQCEFRQRVEEEEAENFQD